MSQKLFDRSSMPERPELSDNTTACERDYAGKSSWKALHN